MASSVLVAESYGNKTITLEESREVTSSAWSTLEQLYTGISTTGAVRDSIPSTNQ